MPSNVVYADDDDDLYGDDYGYISYSMTLAKKKAQVDKVQFWFS